jgi:hypothetical protein
MVTDALRAAASAPSGEVVASDATKWAADKARRMLADGINIQVTGEATNAIVTGVIKSLLDHVDDLRADLNCAIAIGRLAAKASGFTHPAPAAGAMPAREAIARIIDRGIMDQYDVAVREGRFAANGRPWADVAYGEDREAVLAKADAIRALASQEAGQPSDAWRDAIRAALEAIQDQRALAASDFKSSNCMGQRGADRVNAFHDAYLAVMKLTDRAPAQPSTPEAGER